MKNEIVVIINTVNNSLLLKTFFIKNIKIIRGNKKTKFEISLLIGKIKFRNIDMKPRVNILIAPYQPIYLKLNFFLKKSFSIINPIEIKCIVLKKIKKY